MYTAKGKNSREALITENIGLVKRLAYQMRAKLPPSVEVDDLIQAGMIGLMDAVTRFEEGHGASFETYAVQRIRGAMVDELRSTDWMPRKMRQTMRLIETALTATTQKLGRVPTESEVAAHMNLSLSAYQDLLTEAGGHQLIYYEDFEKDEDSNEHFLDHYCVDLSNNPLQVLTNADFRRAVVQVIEALPEREKIIMGLYYEQEMNLKEVGAIMSISESRVCQLHSQAIARMRAQLREQEWNGEA